MSPSLWQILIVVGVALLFFGPKRIPGLGKSLGEAIRGFKKGLTEDAEIDVTESSKKPQEELDGDTNSSNSKNNGETASTQKERKKEEV